jgi:hypothetical protein
MTLMMSSALAEPQNALCRVNNRLATFNNVGSGTLVDTSEDGREGLVLTCAHLFNEGVGEVVVSFPGAKTHGAKLVAIDRDAGLAALAISNPASTQVTVDFTVQQGEPVKACGFGPQGEYACAIGPIVGEAVNTGQTSVLVGDAVRLGDSGGGVFNADGNLVAVVWGEANGVTYASAGVPLKRFLDRVLGQRTGCVSACPNGMCPRVGLGAAPRVISPPKTPIAEATSPVCDELRRRIEALERGKQDRGDFVTRGEATQWMATVNERYEGLHDQWINQPPAVADQGQAAEWIGVVNPAGWGVVAATTLGGWLVGRLWRRVGGRCKERFRSTAEQ